METSIETPSPVRVVPAEAVDALITQTRAELAELERRLEEAVEAADAAEERLRQVPNEVLLDSTLRREILTQIERHAAEVESVVAPGLPSRLRHPSSASVDDAGTQRALPDHSRAEAQASGAPSREAPTFAVATREPAAPIQETPPATASSGRVEETGAAVLASEALGDVEGEPALHPPADAPAFDHPAFDPPTDVHHLGGLASSDQPEASHWYQGVAPALVLLAIAIAAVVAVAVVYVS